MSAVTIAASLHDPTILAGSVLFEKMRIASTAAHGGVLYVRTDDAILKPGHMALVQGNLRGEWIRKPVRVSVSSHLHVVLG